ncbi:hypothetical protein ACF0H5_024239 [Mactra antiquata]
MMRYLTAISICVLQAMMVMSLPASIPFQKTDINILQRNKRSAEGYIGCMHMTSFPGSLQYISDGTLDTCGLYVIGEPDQIIEITFLDFDVKCETGGLVAVFDGWELQNELFPSVYDHPHDLTERYKMYCGENGPKMFLSNQNVALIQFRIPQPGEGFRVMVDFKHNLQPCNAVEMFQEGIVTMKNYGMRRNCTTVIIFPEKVNLLNVDVGVTSQTKHFEEEVGLTDKCMNVGGGDYLQIMDGIGLDPSMMITKDIVCGSNSNNANNPTYILGCQNSAVRMVSSGDYHNTVTFMYSPPTVDDISEQDMC